MPEDAPESAPAAPSAAEADEPKSLYQRLDRTPRFPYKPAHYVWRTAWEWTEATLVRFSPRRAYGWRRWWLRRFGATLAPATGIRPTTRVWHPWHLTMGRHSFLADNVTAYTGGTITIGSHTVVSQEAYLCAASHDYHRRDLPLTHPPIVIGSGVWICVGAFIGPGVTIGDNAIIGARAVVTRDIPPRTIAAGNPARPVKERPRPIE
jgi:putative colanic acid biosynthesis acetyltransferase WcaF